MGGRGSSGGGGGGGGSGKLPDLTGSAKQVAWAESIRQGAFSAVDNLGKNYNSMQSRAPKSDKTFAVDTLGYTLKDVAVVRSEVRDAFSSVTSASKIIDTRAEFSQRRMEELAKLEHRTGQISAARKNRKR